MVHDDQIRFLRPLLHRGDEAIPELRALLPRAGVPARVHPRPQLRIVRQKRKLRAIPGLRQLRPILDLPELLHFLHAFEHRQIQDWSKRSEEHTSEFQSHLNLVCRLLLEKKKQNKIWMLTRSRRRRINSEAIGLSNCSPFSSPS